MPKPIVFDNREPMKSIEKLKGFLLANYSAFPEETNERFLQLNADNNLASFLVSGMELLNRFVQEHDATFAANREALETLGTVAFTVGDIPLWDKGPRALAILAWASSQLNGGPNPSPAVEPDPTYFFVSPVIEAGPPPEPG